MQRRKSRRADGREEALTFVADYLSSLITATEIESAKPPCNRLSIVSRLILRYGLLRGRLWPVSGSSSPFVSAWEAILPRRRLHAPDMWPWSKAWLYGLLSGLTLYVVVQVLRSLWWVFAGRNSDEPDVPEDQHIR